MGIDVILDHFADYLTFFAQVWSFSGFEQFRGSESISPVAVTFLLAGTGLAYLIAFSKGFPGFEAKLRRRQQGKADDGDDVLSKSKGDYALYAVAMFIGAVVLHLTLKAIALIPFLGVTWGPLHDTLNASLAMQSVAQPVSALFLRLTQIAKSPAYEQYPMHRMLIHALSAVVHLYVAAFSVYGLIVVHEVPFWPGILSIAIATAILIAIIFVLAGFFMYPAARAADEPAATDTPATNHNRGTLASLFPGLNVRHVVHHTFTHVFLPSDIMRNMADYRNLAFESQEDVTEEIRSRFAMMVQAVGVLDDASIVVEDLQAAPATVNDRPAIVVSMPPPWQAQQALCLGIVFVDDLARIVALELPSDIDEDNVPETLPKTFPMTSILTEWHGEPEFTRIAAHAVSTDEEFVDILDTLVRGVQPASGDADA